MIKNTIQILLIEDNPGDARIMGELLKEVKLFEYEFVHKTTLREGMELIQKKDFDLVLLDMSLPDSFGQQTFDSIHNKYPDIPIILVSGTEDEELSLKLITLGAQDYINKSGITAHIIERSISHSLERYKLRIELKESEANFRNLAVNMQEGILIASANGKLLYANQYAGELLGYTHEDMQYTLKEDLVDPEVYPMLPERMHDRIAGAPSPLTYETNLRRKDGSVFQAEINGSKTKWHGQDCDLVVFRNITERKQAEKEIQFKNEQLIKINAEKDKFFSIIAHDLRGPLSSFLGLTELMVEDLPDMNFETLQEMVTSMKGSAENVYRLLENLLQWAKIQRGLVPYDPMALNLLPIINESTTMVQESARKKAIVINHDIPDKLEVFVDSNMLQTILRNLISNAVKFTPQGGKIYLTSKVSDSKHIELSIRDTGIGMSAIMLDNVFKIDSKANRNGTEGEPSSGLGLVLCKEFVEKMGGTIRIESEVGQGSEFSFTIPKNINLGNIVDQTESEMVTRESKKQVT